MEFQLLYWHWIVLGIALALSEIFIATFFVLWFGISAVVIGILLLAFPDMPVAGQLIGWAVLSSVTVIAWFKWIKPLNTDKTKAGMSREALIGQVGQVIKVPREGVRGTIRFTTPVLGAEEWTILSEDDLSIGDRVSVEELSGNSLIVSKS